MNSQRSGAAFDHPPTGGQALVRALKSNGVDTIFGLPGLQLDFVFDALYDERDAIRVIHTRHEQATAYMAFGYAQVSGKIGTSLVVPGPGVLNTTAALSTAYACNAPVLSLTGQIPSRSIEGGLGFLHEIPGQATAMASVTKWQGRIDRVEDTPAVVADAFRQLNSGRRRPVLVEMPIDVTSARASGAVADIVAGRDADPEPDSDALEAAARLLGTAKSPAIFVGSGVFGAEAELINLARMLQAPVIMSEHGMGAVDIRDPLAQTLQTGNDLWPQIDVALAVGTRFFHPIVEWGRDDGIKLIRVDIDPEQSIAQWPPDVHIVADARRALAELGDRVGRHNGTRADRGSELAALKQAKEAHLGNLLAPQRDYTAVIRRALPKDGIICFDVSQLHFYSWWGFPVYQPRTVIQPGYQGTLGYGYPTALGAKVAYPDRKVIYVGGDGGFMFNCQELSTAMHFGISVVAIVFNDNAFGNVRRGQTEMFGGRLISSDLTNPDFRQFVGSFGMRYYKVDCPQSLAIVLEEALAADEPALIEVEISGFPNPFPHMFFRRTRGGVK
ncbi:MAG: thiamine pyrophosphate-binding protein [Ancalomicrobiaceae bacterium]|nr:thiamine pyrophosphate-binding protein [Ancalomicrobiaceae bacterium]